MVTLKNIAEKLGVSISTVSAVLNDKKHCYVSEANKKLIIETAKQMNYTPNRMSHGIQGLPTNTIGIIASLFSVPISSTLIDLLNKELSKCGFSVLFGDSYHEKEREKRLICEFLPRGIDGLLVNSCQSKRELEDLLGGRIPYVGFSNEFDGISVTVSKEEGASLAVEHLLTTHQHDAVGFVVNSVKSNLGKYEGYKATLAKHDISYNQDFCIEYDEHGNDLACAAEKVIALGLKAVFASNDIGAGGLIKQLKERGKRIPDDVAVIGFDGLDYVCDLVQPTLTSVRQPMDAVAQKAVELLMRKLKGERVPDKTYYIEPSLRLGQSCGCKEKGNI